MSLKVDNSTSRTNKINKSWEKVQLSRHPQRPYSEDYIDFIFKSFEEFKGDRLFKEDPAILCGIGTLQGDKNKKVFFIGHQKGRKTKDKIKHNFGMASPEGYRKAMRVFELANRFDIPVLCFIDTPGAYPGIEAEERGQAEAIASCISQMLQLKVPSVAVVIGEGGSGGALALASADSLLMLEHATYSVISPESCAAILWSDASKSHEAAHALKLSAQDVFKLKLCDEVIPEVKDGAHEKPEETAKNLLNAIHKHLHFHSKKSAARREKNRFLKFRKIDSHVQK